MFESLPQSGPDAQVLLTESVGRRGAQPIVRNQRGSSHDSKENRDMRGSAGSRHNRFAARPSRKQRRPQSRRVRQFTGHITPPAGSHGKSENAPGDIKHDTGAANAKEL